MMMMMMMIEIEGKPVDGESEAGTTETKPATESPTAGTESPEGATEAPSEGLATPSAGESTSEETSTPKPTAVPPRVVIVTGASSGLGLAVSKMLCAGKHDVILACRSEQKATRALVKIRKHQPDASATYMQVDPHLHYLLIHISY